MTSLSKSALWQKMQDYYLNIGPDAWHDEVVPLQISSNKNLAFAYANIIVGQINDWYTKHTYSAADTPFYIIEIGAGHGKLGFYILKALQELLQNFALPMSLIKYVMTDIAEKNIASWTQHPALQQWVISGNLDFARFNATSDTTLVLQNSGEKLQHGCLSKPVFMICNYLFDSLAHDAFQVRDNKLHEVQIKIDSDADWQEYFEKAKFTYTFEPVSTNYYPDPTLNKILECYEKTLDNNTFMLPIGGIECIKTVEKFSTAALILLLADKGQATIELFDDLGDPDIDIHGSISLMVNFDALKKYFEYTDGTALLLSNPSVDFQVACFCNNNKLPLAHTKHAFAQSLSAASPEDIINLCYVDDDINSNFSSLDQLLAILNLTIWDPTIFYDLHELIIDRIEETEITVEHDRALLEGAKRVWSYFFKLEKSQDLPFALGVLHYALDEYEIALQFFSASIQEFGMNAENLYNIAITHQALDDLTAAKEFANQALGVDPKYTAAKELLKELA